MLSAGTPDTGRELGKSNNNFNTRTYIQALALSAGTPDTRMELGNPTTFSTQGPTSRHSALSADTPDTGRELGKSNNNFNTRTYIQALSAVCRHAGHG